MTSFAENRRIPRHLSQWQDKPQQRRASWVSVCTFSRCLWLTDREAATKHEVGDFYYSDWGRPLLSPTHGTRTSFNLEVRGEFVSWKQNNSLRKYLSPPWPLVTHLTAKTKGASRFHPGMTGHPTQVMRATQKYSVGLHQPNLSSHRKL